MRRRVGSRLTGLGLAAALLAAALGGTSTTSQGRAHQASSPEVAGDAACDLGLTGFYAQTSCRGTWRSTAKWLNIVYLVDDFQPSRPRKASRGLDVAAGILLDGVMRCRRVSGEKVANPPP